MSWVVLCVGAAVALATIAQIMWLHYNSPRARNNRVIVLALSGPIGVGKDTCADVLCERYQFRRLAFADALREVGLRVVRDLCRISSARMDWFHDRTRKETPISALLPSSVGGGIQQRTPREILQMLGTDILRECVDRDIWVRKPVAAITAALQQPAPARFVLIDTRFPNEIAALRTLAQQHEQRLLVLHVQILGTASPSRSGTHASEGGLQPCVPDLVLRNDKRFGLDGLVAEIGRCRPLMTLLLTETAA